MNKNLFQIEELESRLEMLEIGSSKCTSECGTEAAQ